MASSAATTAAEYLDALPGERRAVVSALRDTVLRALPDGYQECTAWGMLAYVVPLARYPETYNGQPLCYAAIAAQKSHYALYLTAPYQDEAARERLRDGFARAGKKLDMGKSCVRFKRLEDVPLEVIAESIAATPPDAFVAQYEAVRAAATTRPARKASRKG